MSKSLKRAGSLIVRPLLEVRLSGTATDGDPGTDTGRERCGTTGTALTGRTAGEACGDTGTALFGRTGGERCGTTGTALTGRTAGDACGDTGTPLFGRTAGEACGDTGTALSWSCGVTLTALFGRASCPTLEDDPAICSGGSVVAPSTDDLICLRLRLYVRPLHETI